MTKKIIDYWNILQTIDVSAYSGTSEKVKTAQELTVGALARGAMEQLMQVEDPSTLLATWDQVREKITILESTRKNHRNFLQKAWIAIANLFGFYSIHHSVAEIDFFDLTKQQNENRDEVAKKIDNLLKGYPLATRYQDELLKISIKNEYTIGVAQLADSKRLKRIWKSVKGDIGRMNQDTAEILFATSHWKYKAFVELSYFEPQMFWRLPKELFQLAIKKPERARFLETVDLFGLDEKSRKKLIKYLPEENLKHLVKNNIPYFVTEFKGEKTPLIEEEIKAYYEKIQTLEEDLERLYQEASQVQEESEKAPLIYKLGQGLNYYKLEYLNPFHGTTDLSIKIAAYLEKQSESVQSKFKEILKSELKEDRRVLSFETVVSNLRRGEEDHQKPWFLDNLSMNDTQWDMHPQPEKTVSELCDSVKDEDVDTFVRLLNEGTVIENILSGQITNNSPHFTHVALRALQLGKISVQQFATTALIYEVFTAFSLQNEDIEVHRVSSSKEILKERLFSTSGKNDLYSSSNTPPRLKNLEKHYQEFIKQMEKSSPDESTFFTITLPPRGSWSVMLRSLEEIKVPFIMPYKVGNVTKMLIPTATMFENFIKVYFGEDAIMPNWVLGESSGKDIQRNIYSSVHDTALIIPGVRNFVHADKLEVSHFSVTVHDWYHIIVGSRVPKEHRIELADLAFKYQARNNTPTRRVWKLIDMEHSDYRSWDPKKALILVKTKFFVS